MKTLKRLILLGTFCSLFVLTTGNIPGPQKKKPVGDPYSSVVASLQSSYYGLVHLALATAAYTDPKANVNIVTSFQQVLAGFPPLPNPQDGTVLPSTTWSLEWGPVLSKDSSNLVYVATCAPSAGGAPYFRIVGLRGTDISAGKKAIRTQLYEDLLAFTAIPVVSYFETLPNPNKLWVDPIITASIASGTAKALKIVTEAEFNDSTLIQHLLNVKTQNTPLVVTGHSLGGALTQAVSAYLAWQLDSAFTLKNRKGIICNNIFPNAFAPPTAGEAAFAKLYSATFPYNYFWFNTSDVVPYAYENIKGIDSLYSGYPTPGGVSCPDSVVELINSVSGEISALNYTRPAINQMSFTAPYLSDTTAMHNFLINCNINTDSTESVLANSWIAQLIWQHFPPCYYQNMGQNFSNMAAYNPFKYP